MLPFLAIAEEEWGEREEGREDARGRLCISEGALGCSLIGTSVCHLYTCPKDDYEMRGLGGWSLEGVCFEILRSHSTI